MMNMKTISARAVIAGLLGLSALGLGTGVANAAPATGVTPGSSWQQDGGWGWGGQGHGGWGGDRGGRGPGWGNGGPGYGYGGPGYGYGGPGYGYGGPGYGYGGPGGGCISGPFGFISLCN
jgi:hypothetical protein